MVITWSLLLSRRQLAHHRLKLAITNVYQSFRLLLVQVANSEKYLNRTGRAVIMHKE